MRNLKFDFYFVFRLLSELKYLDLVCKESLRLYPSVPLFARRANEEFELSELKYFQLNFPHHETKLFSDGKMIPKDSNLIIAPYFMARDPEIFDDPLEFKPERFDVERTVEKMNPYAYIPFSAGKSSCLNFEEINFNSILGSRNCIGQKFAMLEIKSTISKVLRNFQLSTENCSEPQDSLEIIIKSKNGVMIKIEPRLN